MILLAQIHNKLLSWKRDKLDLLWDRFYKKHDGWHKLDAFFELPVWAARLQRIHSEPLEFYVIENLEHFKQYLAVQKPDKVLMSVMDVNCELIKEIVHSSPGTEFVLGGYLSSFEIKDASNYKYWKTLEEYCAHYKLPYLDEIDLSIFKRFYNNKPAYIPRLTLSFGCTNLCKFCTVPSKIIERAEASIFADAQNIIDNTSFTFVYLDDKTFGQASNYKILLSLYHFFKKQNPEFRGFIVQTTIRELINKLIHNTELDACIAYYEIGLEVFSDAFYQRYKKPITTTAFDSVLKEPRLLNRIIYNIMVGVPGTTNQEYQATLETLKKHSNYVHHINIYNFSLYDNTEIAKEQKKKTQDDACEFIKIKGFHSQADQELVLKYYSLFLDYFKQKI